MSSRIRVLSEHTINKIAAGEVIENPASVVKELVENSIDAGSSEICVEIKGGGRQLIRITDNGCGMNQDDAILCLERHATSKIKEVEDIHSIFTMGFRGEAIPSIASISKFMLLTCPQPEIGEKSSNEGTMVIVDGGKFVQCSPAVRSPGTTIEIKSLFFNVPVRKKFQKSPTRDVNEILKMLSMISLGNPHIQFQLISNQESLLKTHVASGNSFQDILEHRIKDVLGSEFAKTSCPLETNKDGYHLQGVIGLPSYTRHNRTGQYLFINNRAVTSSTVSFSVRDGFGTMLSTNRHPTYVLHLKMAGSLVDVNVHPQKKEVRLRQEQLLRDTITQAVDQALQKAGVSLDPFKNSDMESDQFQIPLQTPLLSKITPTFSLEPKNDEISPFKQNNAFTPIFQEKHDTPSLRLFSPPLPQPPNQLTTPNINDSNELFHVETTKKSPPKVLATIDRYILIDGSLISENKPKEGFCLVDQRAAHSRVIFEQLLQKQTSLPIQSLLIPYTIEVSPLETAVVKENLNELNQLGIQIHESGSNTFLIDAIPQIFGNTDMQTLITEMIHHLKTSQDIKSIEKERIKQISLAAGRAAISHRILLSLEEAQSLINRLINCQFPYQCPQGKPTIAFLSQDELNKQFQKWALNI